MRFPIFAGLVLLSITGALGEPAHYEAIRAATVGDLTSLSSALREGPDPHIHHEGTGHSALTAAAFHGQVAATKLLVVHGSDLTRRDMKGLHAVDHAASQGHTKVLRELLRHDMPEQTAKLVGERGPDGMTALHRVVQGKHTKYIEAMIELVKKGAHVDAVTPPGASGNSINSMMLASALGHVAMAQALVNHGADLNAQDPEGRTALHYAAIQNHAPVIEMLLRSNADAHIKDDNGHTAKDTARLFHRTEMMAAFDRTALPAANSPHEVAQKRDAIEAEQLRQFPHIKKELDEKAQQAQFLREKALEAQSSDAAAHAAYAEKNMRMWAAERKSKTRDL